MMGNLGPDVLTEPLAQACRHCEQNRLQVASRPCPSSWPREAQCMDSQVPTVAGPLPPLLRRALVQELSDLLARKDSCEGQPDSGLVQKKARNSLEERCSWALLEGVLQQVSHI